MNYVERESADKALVDSLSRKKHITIYGSSKQGKTSLRKHCLKLEEYITIHCASTWSIENIYEQILKSAGYEITLSNSTAVSGKQKIEAKMSAKVFGIGSSVGAGLEESQESDKTTSPMKIDSGDVNDIIDALKNLNFEKFVILEDFHYLPIETQKEFSFALKAFHESASICFVIIGVWLEENRLTTYNGDLTGRVISINADKWEKFELEEVIKKGEELLNISFGTKFKSDLLKTCNDSVYIVQEVCYACCDKSNITRTQDTDVTIGDDLECSELIKAVVDQQRGRFNSFLTQFQEGFQSTELEMYKWLLYPILTTPADRLEKGIKRGDISSILKEVHPKGNDLNPGNLTTSLKAVSSLQVKKGIKPIILDYDETNLLLNVVDKSFIIWLAYQDQKELLDFIDIPN